MKLKLISILAFFLVIQIGAAQKSLNEVLKNSKMEFISYRVLNIFHAPYPLHKKFSKRGMSTFPYKGWGGGS